MTTIVINCGLIFVGAFVMLFSIIRSKRILETMPLIPEKLRGRISQLVNLHRLLMAFFLIGYIVVLVGFAVRLAILSNLFVSVIFFLGAVFVFMGVAIEVQLLTEIQKTLSGLLPICAKCKKVRDPNADGMKPDSWQNIESYISSRAEVDFTHGYCPECYAEIMAAMDAE